MKVLLYHWYPGLGVVLNKSLFNKKNLWNNYNSRLWNTLPRNYFLDFFSPSYFSILDSLKISLNDFSNISYPGTDQHLHFGKLIHV